MGARILALAAADKRFQPIAGVERENGDAVGRFAADGRTPIVGNIREVLAKTDVVIDFTAAAAAVPTAQAVAKAGRALVVGTTGLSDAQVKGLRALSRRIPIVFSPNMSVGMNMLFDLVAKAAEALAHYDIEIIEAHHNLKKDAPSGSAMKLAQVAADASRRRSRDFVYGREGLVGARTKKEIGISAVRAGDIVGDHTVLIAGPGERLELTHRAHSRDAFASGALEAAAWVVRRKPGFYSMKEVLGLK
jgi:4-hydroxy-tetrahydrodipicolinate reductase